MEERFADLLKGLVPDDEVMGWMTETLRKSHEDERRDHEEAMTRLQAEYDTAPEPHRGDVCGQA